MSTLKDYTYDALIEWRKRHPRASKIGHNTHLTGDGSTVDPFKIRYHATDIVTMTADFIHFDTGGWETVTTKARMNAAMPAGCGVYQREWTWYLKVPSQSWEDDHAATGRTFAIARVGGEWTLA